MSVVISTGYGKENLKDQSVSLMSFAIEKPFVRTLPGRKFPRKGNIQSFPVSAHPEINGMLYLDTLEMPEGALLMAQASHRFRGSGIRDGSFFFRARADGPMNIVKAILPTDIGAMVSTRFVVLQGRGDILSCAEAIETYGLELRKSYIDTYFDAEEIAECFIFEITDQGTPAPKMEKVELADGTSAVVPSARTARRMRVR